MNKWKERALFMGVGLLIMSILSILALIIGKALQGNTFSRTVLLGFGLIAVLGFIYSIGENVVRTYRETRSKE